MVPDRGTYRSPPPGQELGPKCPRGICAWMGWGNLGEIAGNASSMQTHTSERERESACQTRPSTRSHAPTLPHSHTAHATHPELHLFSGSTHWPLGHPSSRPPPPLPLPFWTVTVLSLTHCTLPCMPDDEYKYVCVSVCVCACVFVSVCGRRVPM